MSEHAWVQENLDVFLVGGLSAQEEGRVERHLESCTECAHAKSEISDTEQLMEGLFASARPDAGLEDRAILQLRRARKPRPSWMRFASAAAAVILFGMIGAGVQMFALEGGLPFLQTQKDAKQVRLAGFVLGEGLVGGAILKEKDSQTFYREMQAEVAEQMAKIGKESMDALDVAKSVTVNGSIAKDVSPEGLVGKAIKITKAADFGYTSNFYDGRSRTTATEKGKNEEWKERGFYHLELDKRDGDKQGTKDKELALKMMFDDVNKDVKDLTADKMRDTLLRTFDMPAKPGENKPGDTGGGGGKGGGGGFGPDGKDQSKVTKAGDGLMLPGYFNTPIVSGTTPTSPAGGNFVPTNPPPVTVGAGPPAGLKKEEPKGEKPPTGDNAIPKPSPQPKDPPENTGRKIIRTGEMEFETTSFDSAVDSINTLINNVKGGFIATVNSDKLPNGKMKGSVVVRMPPQFLDKFLTDLRRELTKMGELKNQRIGSLDVTKQYTDIESRLRAARAIEERLIAIIKTGKGEIKDLVAAERELGIWRTKIEEMEGEIRYYSNQVALSTITIQLYEKEIQSPTAIVVTEIVQMRLEVDDVAKSHQIAMKAVEELKGRITRSELKQHSAGQLLSVLSAEIPPSKKDAFLDKLKALGIVSEHQESQRQHTEGGTGRAPELKPKAADVVFEVTMNNTANVRPKFSVDLKVGTTDVPLAYTKLLAEIAKIKGQVRDGNLNEQDKMNVHARIDFNIPTSAKAAFDKLLESIGPTLERINLQAPISELSTERKFGYVLVLRDFASIPAKQAIVEVVAASDVPGTFAKLQEAIAKAKGQITDAKLNENDKFNITAQLDFTIPSSEQKAMQKLLEDLGTVLSRNNVQTPAHVLTTATKFGFHLVLRDFASIPPSKASDLKVATNDVPGSYAKLLDAITKAKGQLVDAKLNEADRFNITAQVDFSVPADEKATIDKLLLEMGTILSRNNVQAPMAQLSTAKKFGYSVVLRDFATILPTHAAEVTVATNDVPANYALLVDAIVKAKGQMSEAKLNETDKLNISAILKFTVPTSEKPAIDKMLVQIGTLLSRNNVQAPLQTLTSDGKFGYSLVLRDFANIPPRETFHLQIAATDVPAAFRELQDAVTAAKGQVTVGQLIEDSKIKIEAQFNFDVPAAERNAIEKLFTKVGFAVLGRTSSQVAVAELATDQKVGFKLTLRSTAAIPPRETVAVKLEVKDVDARAAELKELIAAGKGRVIDSNIDRHENGQVSAVLKFEVPFASQDTLLKQIKGTGTLASQKAVRNPQIAENELTTSHIIVTLTGASPIMPQGEEGLGAYVRTSLYMSFKVFSVCLMLIILGVSAVLPWALVVWIVYKVYQRLTGTGQMQLAQATGPMLPKGDGPAAG